MNTREKIFLLFSDSATKIAITFSLIVGNLLTLNVIPLWEKIMSRHWVKQAISEIEADFQRSADTHLIRVCLPQFPGIYLYLKDESTHPTGSLKHAWPVHCFYTACRTVGFKKIPLL